MASNTGDIAPVKDLLGYARDFVVAVMGLLMILGLLNQEVAGGIVLVVMTFLALGSHAYSLYRERNEASSNRPIE